MLTLQTKWESALRKMPLVAILRGIQPEECIAVGSALIEQGFEIIEVPLNSPRPYLTIEKLVKEFGENTVIGAGTVLSVDQVNDSITAGSSLVVAPNHDDIVATACAQNKVIYCPGVATPSEAFTAIKSGASALKLFPAEMINPSVVKAIRAVLPASTVLIPVGSIAPGNMYAYVAAGANGFGIGSALYKPGKDITAIGTSAREFADAYRRCVEIAGPVIGQ